MHSSLPAETDADVIIIGAGISGMSAAFYIFDHEPALDVLILEATNRLGGRALTVPVRISDKNHLRAFDLGGQFIGTHHVHILDLVKRLDLHLVQASGTNGKIIWDLEPDKSAFLSDQFFELKHLQARIELTQFSDLIKTMCENVSFNNPHAIPDSNELDHQTMEAFIREKLQSSLTQNLVRHTIRISCGIEPSQMTVLFYLACCNGKKGVDNYFLDEVDSEKLWIQGGADQICQKIASLIGRPSIKTNVPVTEITRYQDHITVETEKYIYQSKYVIIAVPPKEILDIQFSPPLTKSRLDLLQSLDPGHLIKFVATYKTAFWRDLGYAGNVHACGKQGGKGPIHVCYDVTYKNWPALTGRIASTDCLEQPADSYKTEVLQQLATYFGEDALHPIDYFEKSWLDEPYIYHCVINNPGIGNMDKYHEIKRPLGRLFWAGTETAACWNGYLNGAVQAGYRAAIELLYDSRPQILTTRDIEFITPRVRETTTLANTLIRYGTSWKTYAFLASLFFTVIFWRRRR